MNENQTIFGEKKWLFWAAVLVILADGLGIRFYDLTDAPLDFHPTRQLHSALMARGMYYQNLPDVPEWQRELAVQQWKQEGLIEPPIMERLTAWTYRLAGGENLSIARVYSIFFWTLGGMGLLLLLKDLVGADGAVIGLAYYMILPYAALASRSFQPDPLLTAGIVWGWWAMLRWYRQQTWKWVVIAGLLAGLAIFIKSTAIFFIGPAWMGLILADQGLQKAVRNRQVWALGILTVLPYAIFHVYGMYIVGLLGGQFSLRFFPNLWIDPVTYLRWKGMIDSTLVFEWFLVALLGTFLIREEGPRTMLIAVWAGYFVYGMTFSHHISTHDYYQLPFVPAVAVGLAAAAQMVVQRLRAHKLVLYSLVIGVTLFWVTMNAWDVRVKLKRDDYRGDAAFWTMLGEKLEGKSVVSITPDYGYRLAYWGWTGSENWLSSGDFNYRALAGQEFDVDQMFAEEVAGKDVFLVTMFGELDRQPKVKNLLYNQYPLLEEDEEYVIFDLQNPLPAKDADAGK
ncbi:MAG: glycosyltransferase family 39 protein [Anaerolineaceae bacterium]|nr:glycosyltransferase family 39 protein [Anaerolineaceae bacterium]